MTRARSGTSLATAARVAAKFLKPIALIIEPDKERREARCNAAKEALADAAEIQAVSSFAAAEALLTEVREKKRRVAVVIAGEDGDADVREQFFARVQTVGREIKIILVARDPAAQRSCADAVISDEDALEPHLADQRLPERRSGTENSADESIEIIGDEWSARCHEVKDLLCRHRVPYRWINIEGDRRAARRTKQGLEADALPLLVFPDGTELANPEDEAIVGKLGFDTKPAERFYDLIIVGGGPAGLAAAVYASSEGLQTLIVERDVPGGQAGTSALIENYLGFPEGLSGAELSERAVAQAERFGTEMLVTREAKSLRAEGNLRVITMSDGSEVAGRSVIIATGVRYKRLKAEGAERLYGSGIYYGAAGSEAARFRKQNVALLGGGNSAGQAAMLLARHAQRVTMLFAEEDLDQRMSQYLVARIKSTPNIELRPATTIVEVKGKDRVESIVTEEMKSKQRDELSIEALFVSIGATPHTGWLAETLQLDEYGFIITGKNLTAHAGLEEWPLDRWPFHLETNIPGVFAAGDVRHASVKRIGSAVGEGTMAVQFVHDHLRDQ